MGYKQLNTVSFSKLHISLLTPIEKFKLAVAVINTLACGLTLPLFVYCFAKATSLNDGEVDQEKEILYNMGLDTIYLGIGALVSGISMMLLWFNIGVKVDQRIRRMYLNYLLHVGHLQINIDPFKVKNDCIEIESGLGKKVGFFLFGLTMYVTSEIIILAVNWKIGLVNIYVFVSLVMVGIFWFCSNQPLIALKKERFECSALNAEEALKNIFTVLTLSNFAFEYWKYETRLRVSRKRGIRYGKWYAINLFCFLFLVLNSFALTVWYAGKLVIDSKFQSKDNMTEIKKEEERIKEGNVLVVIVAILFLHLSLGALTQNAKHILTSCVNACRFFKFKTSIDLYEKKEDKKPSWCLRDFNSDTAIEIQNLPPFNISITIPSNTKTNIVIEDNDEDNICLNFIEAINQFSQEKAAVLLFGNNVKQYKVFSVRRLIASVNGNCNMLNATIFENVTIACERLTKERLQKAIDISHCGDIIKDYGGDFVVGPRGEYLSKYSRFRLSIARTIMTPAVIYVIDYKGFEHYSLIKDIDDKLTRYALENKITYIAFNLKPDNITQHNYIYIGKRSKPLSSLSQYYNLDLNQNLNKVIGMGMGNESDELLVQSERSKTYSEKINSNNGIVLTKAVKHFPVSYELSSRRVSKKEVITRYPKHIALTVIIIFLNGTISPLNGRIIGYTLLALSGNSIKEIKESTEFYSLIFLVLSSVSAAAQAAESYLYNYIGESIKTNVRLLQYEKYMNVDYNYFKDNKHPNYKLISKLNFQSKNISGVAVYLFFTAWTKGISFVIGFIISMHSNRKICLLQCCLVPLIFLFLYFNWKVNRINKPIGVKYEMDYGGIVEECYFNRRLINSLNIQKKILHRFSILKTQINPPRYWSNRVYSYSFGCSLFAMLVADGIMIITASFLINTHDLKFDSIIKSSYTMLISIYGLVLIQSYIASLAISWNVTQGQTAVINDPCPPQGISEYDTMKDVPIQGLIQFNKITFGFNKDKKLFEDLSLTFMPNTCYAIHGKGKTTLFNLLLRIYTLSAGNITIGGIDITKMNMCDLRHSFAYFHEGLNYDYLKKNYCYHNVTGELLSDNEMITLMIANANYVIIDDEFVIYKIVKGVIDLNTLKANKIVIVTTQK